MLTIEEALQLVQDKWQSVNSPGTIRKKDTYIKRFRLMAEEKGFEFPCQEFYDMFMESAIKTGSQDIITNHYNLVRTMDEVSKDFFDFVLKIAGGELQTKNEQHDCRGIAIFKDGVML